MVSWQLIAGILGAIVLVGNAGAVIHKWIKPALGVKNDVKTLKEEVAEIREHEKNDYEAIKKQTEMNKLQCQAMVCLLNHMIDGNGVAKMKETRDNMLEMLVKM